MDLVKAVEQDNLRNSFPEVSIGDYVKVHLKIKEGTRERIQIFEGSVIARKGGGLSETMTVRRILRRRCRAYFACAFPEN